MFLKTERGATALAALSLVQVKIKGSKDLNNNSLFCLHTHTHTESDVQLYYGRSKPSICSGSASFGHPRSACLFIRYSPDEGRPHFAQCSLDCCLFVCFPDSGESDIWSVSFPFAYFINTLQYPSCLSLRSSPCCV